MLKYTNNIHINISEKFHQWKHIFDVGGWNHAFRIIGLEKSRGSKMLVKTICGPIKF